MDERTIQISISQLHDQRASIDLTVGAMHRTRAGRRLVPLKSSHMRVPCPYAVELTAELAVELRRAVALVLAGWYENSELPFDL